MAKGIKQIKFTFTSPNDDDSGWERNILSKKKNKKETLYKFNNTTELLIEREIELWWREEGEEKITASMNWKLKKNRQDEILTWNTNEG